MKYEKWPEAKDMCAARFLSAKQFDEMRRDVAQYSATTKGRYDIVKDKFTLFVVVEDGNPLMDRVVFFSDEPVRFTAESSDDRAARLR